MVKPNMYSEFVTYCKQKGYMCLSTEKEYLKTTQPEVICPNLHIYSVRPYDFKKRGYRCVLCRLDDRHQKFEEICEKFQYTCLSPPLSFKDLKSDIFVFCKHQHLQTAKYKNVIQNGFNCEDCELQDITLDSMKKMLETLDFSLVDVTKDGSRYIIQFKCLTHDQDLHISYLALQATSDLKVFCDHCIGKKKRRVDVNSVHPTQVKYEYIG